MTAVQVKVAIWVFIGFVVALYVTSPWWDHDPEPPGRNYCIANPADPRC